MIWTFIIGLIIGGFCGFFCGKEVYFRGCDCSCSCDDKPVETGVVAVEPDHTVVVEQIEDPSTGELVPLEPVKFEKPVKTVEPKKPVKRSSTKKITKKTK